MKSKTYFVSVITPSGCESERLSVDATVVEYETAAITATGNVLTSNYNNAQWYLNNEPIIGAVGSSIVADKAGVYSTITFINYCQARADFTYEITAIEELNEDLVAYPNPVKGILYLRLPSNEIIQDAYLINGTGMKLNIKPAISDEHILKFNMMDLSEGFYALRVITTTTNHTIKIIKDNSTH